MSFSRLTLSYFHQTRGIASIPIPRSSRKSRVPPPYYGAPPPNIYDMQASATPTALADAPDASDGQSAAWSDFHPHAGHPTASSSHSVTQSNGPIATAEIDVHQKPMGRRQRRRQQQLQLRAERRALAIRVKPLDETPQAQTTSQLATVPPVGTAAFEARTHFSVSHDVKKACFPGHQAKGLSKIRNLVGRASFVIEARDYRVPLSSLNRDLEMAVAGRPRLVVYTKCDLVDRDYIAERTLTQWHMRHCQSARGGAAGAKVDEANNEADNDYHYMMGYGVGGPGAADVAGVLFHSDPSGGVSAQRGEEPMISTRRLLNAVRDLRARNPDENPVLGSCGLVIGMPNSGKSTLVNLLRSAGLSANTAVTSPDAHRAADTLYRKKAQQTSQDAGVTRKISGPIRILPRIYDQPLDSDDDKHENGSSSSNHSRDKRGSGRDKRKHHSNGMGSIIDNGVYVFDTPGIFVPYVPSVVTMIKLALAGIVQPGAIPHDVMADYLLFRANQVNPRLYERWSPPTNYVDEWLENVARATGKLGKAGSLMTDVAAAWIIAQWRNGWLGRFGLDDLGELALGAAARRMTEPRVLSVREAKLKLVAEKQQRRVAAAAAEAAAYAR